MGRSTCCSKERLNRGAWTAIEDKILKTFIEAHGDGKWRSLPKRAGLNRCGKSCRLRWLNYLRPDIKRGNISPDEEDLIIRLHKLLGNRWSLIAARLPGRTDNEIKNYWNTTLVKKIGPSSRDVNITKSVTKTNTSRKKNSQIPPLAPAIRTRAIRCTNKEREPLLISQQTPSLSIAPQPDHTNTRPSFLLENEDGVHNHDNLFNSIHEFENINTDLGFLEEFGDFSAADFDFFSSLIASEEEL